MSRTCQPAPGPYSAIANLTTKLSLKKGKNSLLTSLGCSGGEQKISVTETFVAEPDAARRAVGDQTTGQATCKK